jgi:acid phosphatase
MAYLNSVLGHWMPAGQRIAVDSSPKIHGILDSINASLSTPNPSQYLPPEFFDQRARGIMERIATEEENRGFAESREFRVLGIGEPLSEAVQLMTSKAEAGGRKGTREIGEAHKMALFACHDSTIGGMMTALRIMRDPNWFWPPYTSFLAIEMFSDEMKEPAGDDAAERYVRMSFLGRALIIPACQPKGNHLDGDQSFCTLVSEKHRKFTKQELTVYRLRSRGLWMILHLMIGKGNV